MKRETLIPVLLCLIPAAIAVWMVGLSRSPRDPNPRSGASLGETSVPPRESRQAAAQFSPLPAEEIPVAPRPEAGSRSPWDERDHHHLEELRQLGLGDPDRTLALTEPGTLDVAGSSVAAERAWWRTRALVELRRFDEAKKLAKDMTERFAESPFAFDVRRHLLTHPMGER